MKQNIDEARMKHRHQWTVEEIEKQSERGGVHREKVLFLIDIIKRLEEAVKHAIYETERWRSCCFELNGELGELREAIIEHRNTHMETLYPEGRLEANRNLWSLVYPEEDEA